MGSINREYIHKLIQEINETISAIIDATNKPYDRVNTVEKYAIRYHLIVIAEALIALALHIARRMFNTRPETPIHALQVLRDNQLLIGDEYRDVVNIVKLRNLLIHRYWTIDDEKIYNTVKKDFKNIRRFLKRISHVI